MSISLQSLLTPSKTVEVDYPNFEGFKVKINFLSRESLINLRKSAVTMGFNRATRTPTETVDDALFLKNYVKNVVKGWKGLKYKYLTQLMLVDLSDIKDLEEELDYSEENALVLMKNSTDFDEFITSVVSDLSNFTKYSSAA